MTRLIDADSIPWDVEGVGEIPVITKEEIDEMPTVDAVPVDFIRSEIERMKKGSNRYYSECEAYADDLDIMLAEWERRQ